MHNDHECCSFLLSIIKNSYCSRHKKMHFYCSIQKIYLSVDHSRGKKKTRFSFVVDKLIFTDQSLWGRGPFVIFISSMSNGKKSHFWGGEGRKQN